MSCLKTATEGPVLIATMARGKANAINGSMLDELKRLIDSLADDQGVRALVIASEAPKFFSAGFELSEVFRYDGHQMRSFFGKFIDVYEGIQQLPQGVVAAVSGHAYAGGAVLAVACDWRIMADRGCGFALNEVNLGVILPLGVTRMVLDLLGTGYARQLLLSGEPATPDEALRIGLVQELASVDDVLPRAVERAHEFASKPAAAFAAIKHKLRFLSGGDATSDHELLDPFIQQWDSEEALMARQSLLEAMNL